MIGRFQFDWTYIRNISQEDLDRLRVLVPAMPLELEKAREIYGNHFTADIRQVLKLGAKIEMRGEDYQDPSVMILMNDKLEQLAEKVGVLGRVSDEQHLSFNTKCSVHVPGLGLMLVNEVRIEEDLCTDTLQGLLDKGWRILAICPQPDQRRPDYVLGRQNPAEKESH